MVRTVDHRARGIKLVLWQILFLNLLVSVAKATWGVISGSSAMVADGIHSLTDSSSNIVALVAMAVASKPLDEDHPYGHQKYESFASAIIGVMLLLAAWRVGSQSVSTLVAYAQNGTLPTVEVTAVSFAIMFTTLGINIFVVWFESRQGKVLDSDVLQSDAKHTLSDIWVTMGVIISLVPVKMGVPIAAPIVGLFVAFAVVWAAFDVFKGVNSTFSDQARLDPYDVREKAMAFPGVKGCHNVRTRGTGAFVHMDMSILVDPDISVDAGHEIAQQLEAWLCSQYPGLQDVVVHVEPDNAQQRVKPFMAGV
jgi:cation diffusion facilitator family transporter